jgi:hypothetical protein
MPKQFATMELVEQCDGVPAGTVCVLLDELAKGSAWLVECFDASGNTIDVVAVPLTLLRPTQKVQTSNRTAA